MKTLGRSAISGTALALMAATVTLNAHAAPINVALASSGGVATQSSDYHSVVSDGQPAGAWRAIDGNTDSNWHSSTPSVTSTEYNPQPWWQVTLGGGASAIGQIDVWNRTDCCGTRLDIST